MPRSTGQFRSTVAQLKQWLKRVSSPAEDRKGIQKGRKPAEVPKAKPRQVEIAPGLILPEGFSSYQDVWLKGDVVQRGTRNCASRYKLIHDALEQRFRPGFTLLDIGASEGYFSIRLSEDLAAQPTLLERKRELRAIAAAQGNPVIRVISGRFSKETIAKLGKFDVVIALSIVHHFPNWGEMIKQVLRSGDAIIIELPADNERSTRRADAASGMLEVLRWYNPKLLGETAGYAKEATRQLWCVDFPTEPKGANFVKGRVTGGRASSTRQVQHYSAGFERHTGLPVHPGTLNLRLDRPVHFKNGWTIESEKGPYHLFPCKIEGLGAYVVKPPLAKNRARSLEIMASVPLREVFGLEDESTVTIELDPAHLGTEGEIQYAVKSPVATPAT